MRSCKVLLQISHTTSFSVFLSLSTTPHYSNWSVRYGLCALTPYVFKHFAGELQALSLSSCSIKPSYLSSNLASESPFGTLLLNLCPGLEPRPCPFESHQSLSRLFVTGSLWLNTSGLTTYSSPGPLLTMLSSFTTSGNIVIVQSLIGYQKTYHCELIVTSPSSSSCLLRRLLLQCCFAHSPYQHVFSSMCANDLGIAAFESHELN